MRGGVKEWELSQEWKWDGRAGGRTTGSKEHAVQLATLGDSAGRDSRLV